MSTEQTVEQLRAEVVDLRAELSVHDQELARLQVQKDEADRVVIKTGVKMREVHAARAPLCEKINKRLRAIEALEGVEPTVIGG